MNKPDAMARLDAYCPLSADPALSDAQVAVLLQEAVTVDADGVEPSEDGWTPTYSRVGVLRAAAEGWTMKKGLVADRFDFQTDGQSFQRGQLLDHCEAMAASLRRKIGSAV